MLRRVLSLLCGLVVLLIALRAGRLGSHESGTPEPQDLPALAHVHCEGGFADIYPCNNVDLLSFLPLAAIGGGTGNDVWGWTDPRDGKEYALMGRSNGTAFVDVSDPEAPVYVGNLPPVTVDSLWRDIKVYGDHAFIVSEAPDHGLQVFDLTQLQSVTAPPAEFATTAHYAGFGSAHNLAIDEDTGYAYAVGSNTCLGGLHMIDIIDPRRPTFAGCFSADGYTHDAQCIVYAGPDAGYAGAEVCFNANEDTLTIVDVSDKAAPVQLSRTGYEGRGYTHQGWLTDDHRYFLIDDETDELSFHHNTRTYIWDVTDLEAPILAGSYTAPSAATDHNLYVNGRYLFAANYRSGLRILDLAGIDHASLGEVGFFDIYPADDEPGFNGAWSVYPYFGSGTLVVSGIEQGLYVVRADLGGPPQTATATRPPTASRPPTATLTHGPVGTPTATLPPGGTGGANLALGKPAAQSSTAFGATAQRAADGIADGDWRSGSVTHTNEDWQAWWQIDLGAVEPIAAIDLWNRTDCCGSRLAAFYVMVSDAPFASTDLTATRNQPGVWAHYVPAPAGAVVTVAVNRTGRYVRVQLTGTNFLSLAEVQIWGAGAAAPPTATAPPGGGGTNFAAGRAAVQSSTAFGAAAGRAVDGVTDGDFWAAGSVTHTDADAQAWWQVDLGAVAPVDTIEIWNRADCCGNRLRAFYVLVSDMPFASTGLSATLSQPGVWAHYVAGPVGTVVTVGVHRSARFVRVQLSGADFLSLAEVQVWGGGSAPATPTPTATPPVPATPTTTASAGAVNLALGRPALQSSTAFGAAAGRAVDGSTNGAWEAGSVTHTDADAHAWWQVDLGTVEAIGSVEIWNRTDCCGGRLSGFYVFVSEAPFASSDLDATLSQPGVSALFTAGAAGSPTLIAVGRSGRYVRVQLTGADFLSLAEVRVWRGSGAPVPTPTAGAGGVNLALGRPATQSSTAFGGIAARAVDGIASGNWAAQSVTHTSDDPHAWWEVDLGAVAALDAVEVWNRTDCCASRLSRFYVFVSDVPFVSSDLDATLGQAGIGAFYIQGAAGSPTTVAVARSGRYVRVQLTGTDFLSLAEVRVWSGTGPVVPRALGVEVVSTRPHDPEAFTQGLLLHDGALYESTGLFGQSSLREVDPVTGAVRRRADLAPELFGEGLARVGERLIQLTWQDHVALVYDRASFAEVERFSYATEGWGLCFDGQRLVMSDGTDTLYFRDPQTFAVISQVRVRREGSPLARLNELECVGDAVYANVWLTDTIVEIDPATGAVTAVVDASGLLTPAERAALPAGAVLNGIAYDGQAGAFLVTGKLWPKLFEVRFVPGGS